MVGQQPRNAATAFKTLDHEATFPHALVALYKFTLRCLATVVARRSFDDVLHSPAEFFVSLNRPAHSIRQRSGVYRSQRASDSRQIAVEMVCIEPRSPWENGYCESLNWRLRDELFNGEIFKTLTTDSSHRSRKRDCVVLESKT